jgi:hypothetical protein
MAAVDSVCLKTRACERRSDFLSSGQLQIRKKSNLRSGSLTQAGSGTEGMRQVKVDKQTFRAPRILIAWATIAYKILGPSGTTGADSRANRVGYYIAPGSCVFSLHADHMWVLQMCHFLNRQCVDPNDILI